MTGLTGTAQANLDSVCFSDAAIAGAHRALPMINIRHNRKAASMRYNDISSPYSGPSSHPYLVRLVMDSSNLAKFVRIYEGHPEVRQLGAEQTSPDRWTVYAACASRSVRALLERHR